MALKACDWCRFHPWRCLACAGVFVSIMMIMAWALDRTAPIEMLSGEAHQRFYSPGDRAEVIWDFIAHRRTCDGEVSRWLTTEAQRGWRFDLGPAYLVPERDFMVDAPLPMHRTIALPGFRLPDDMPPDKPGALEPQAAYHVEVTWRCNPLHRFWPIKSAAPVILFQVRPRS